MKSNVGEEIVKDIINFQWRSCLQAIKSDASTIEISELGIFKLNEWKAKIKLEKMKEKILEWKENPDDPQAVQYIEDYENKIKILESKLNK